jgi:hypothetical protein
MRIDGMGTSTIAKKLNEEGIDTPCGTHPWTRVHVWRLLKTRDAVQLFDKLKAASA